MKRILVAICLFVSASAHAQTVENDLVGLGMNPEIASYIASILPAGAVLGNNTYLKARNAANSADISALKVDGSDDTILNADTGDVIKLAVAGTPEVQVSDDAVTYIGNTGLITAPTKIALSGGAATTPVAWVQSDGLGFASGGAQAVFPAAAVITPSTGVPTPAAGNTLTERNTIIAAGAPTAAFVVLPLATASVGKKYTLFNQGSNPVAIVPQTGVINVSAALTPFACTTLKECECTGLTTGVFGCSQK